MRQTDLDKYRTDNIVKHATAYVLTACAIVSVAMIAVMHHVGQTTAYMGG